MKTKLFFIFLLVINISFSQTDIEYLFSADVQNVSQDGDVINYSFHVVPFGSDSYSQIYFSNTYGLENLQYVSGDSNNNAIIETGEDWFFTATHIVTQAELDNNGVPSNSSLISYELTFVIDKPNGEAFIYYVLEDVVINASTYLADDVFCADEINNSISLDLTYKDSLVLNGNNPNDYTITYYQNYNDAFNATNVLSNPYVAYDTPRVYARREKNIDTTFEIFSFVIYINDYISANVPTPLVNCQDNFTFDLASKNDEIIGGQTNMIVTYHPTLLDAENNLNMLPFLYSSTISQQIFVRVTSFISSCYNTTTLMLDFIDCNESYMVTPLTYQIYNQPIQNTFNLDDGYTNLIPLNFNFNYFGINYQQVVVGTNSVISFSQADASSYCPWPINNDDIIPNANVIDNAILGAYQDYDNSNGIGSQAYGFIGTAPFRKFVVFFDDVSLYACNSITSSNQMVLYETYNFIDVQIKDRNVCTTWNNGNAILGIQNIGGTEAYFPANRNTGAWEAHDEGWRFRPQQDQPDFQYIVCDANVDGVEVFDLGSIISEFEASAGSVFNFFETLADAEAFTNFIPLNYTNISNTQTIFLRIDDNLTGLEIKQILLAAIDCAADYDLDNVATIDEDLNANGNFGDDDTDGDQIPDFLDEDDDGDYVLTNVEAIQTRNSNALLDTDGDQIPNYLDNDDDGDNILSLDEDINGNYNLLDDDTDGDNIPDYLDNESLSVNSDVLNSFQVYPNPAKDILTIELSNILTNTKFSIYTLQGRVLYNKQNLSNTKTEINISNLSSGVYFMKLENDNQTAIRKFVKK